MTKKIAEMNTDELKVELLKLREELRTKRFGVVAKPSKNVREARNTRVAIAQILTKLNSAKNA